MKKSRFAHPNNFSETIQGSFMGLGRFFIVLADAIFEEVSIN